MTDLGGLFDEHGVGVLSGVLGTMLIKEMVGRFLKRSATIEEAAEKKRDELIGSVLSEVRDLHITITRALERLDGHVKTLDETRDRVDAHGARISAIETRQAALCAKMEFISEAKDD